MTGRSPFRERVTRPSIAIPERPSRGSLRWAEGREVEERRRGEQEMTAITLSMSLGKFLPSFMPSRLVMKSWLDMLFPRFWKQPSQRVGNGAVTPRDTPQRQVEQSRTLPPGPSRREGRPRRGWSHFPA
ncbi:hypothetical protein chiPu_0026414, partial [Chiloscyllium punctatum]|nr:hypothetical protein [Chiloscyllium punctatum]